MGVVELPIVGHLGNLTIFKAGDVKAAKLLFRGEKVCFKISFLKGGKVQEVNDGIAVYIPMDEVVYVKDYQSNLD